MRACQLFVCRVQCLALRVLFGSGARIAPFLLRLAMVRIGAGLARLLFCITHPPSGRTALFKNLLVYRVNEGFGADLAAAEQALAKTPFMPCSATQEKSFGWVSPRGQDHAPMIESVNGQWILRYVTESKILPASVIQSRVDEKVQAIEESCGRKPGKKERQDIKDEAKLDLLPLAFTKRQGTWVWIDRHNRWLVIDAGAQGRADEIITALVEAIPGFVPRLLQTVTAPAAAMAQWLAQQEGPPGFALGDECELKATDETRAAVRYARHALEIDEIREHIAKGKRPTRLALGWGDRASLVLTEALQVKKLAFSDLVFESKSDADDDFDTDVALTTGELQLLLPELVQALDGEMEPGQQNASGTGMQPLGPETNSAPKEATGAGITEGTTDSSGAPGPATDASVPW